MHRGEEEQGLRALRAMENILFGAAAALAVCTAVLFLAAVGVSGGWLKESGMDRITVGACVIGAFVGALVALRRHPARGLVMGLAVGGCLFLLLLTIGWLCYDSMSLDNGGVALLAGCLCGGALAGLLASGRAPKGKRTSKRRKARPGR